MHKFIYLSIECVCACRELINTMVQVCRVRGQIADFLKICHEDLESKLKASDSEECNTNLFESPHHLMLTLILVQSLILKYFLMIKEKNIYKLKHKAYFLKQREYFERITIHYIVPDMTSLKFI